MSIIIDVSVTRNPWLDHPQERWNNGLLSAGNGWMSAAKKYPAKTSGTYDRTGTLWKKAGFRITREGEEMELLDVLYYKYLLFGTGIFGYKGTPIVPKKEGGVLAWKVSGRNIANAAGMGSTLIASGVSFSKKTGKSRHNTRRDLFMVFARSVKGTIWPGKLQEAIATMKSRYQSGIKKNIVESE